VKSKKGKVDASDSESAHQDDVEDKGNGDSGGAASEVEAGVNEDAKVNSKRKNKRGRKKGNNAEAEDGGTETKKKKRNVGGDETAEAVEYEVSKRNGAFILKMLVVYVGHSIYAK